MNYEGNIIRPPSEANSIILKVTVGCSHNRCTFCGAYKDVRFRIKDAPTIDADIAFAARHCRRQHRVFLADGDALIIPTPRLEGILAQIRQQLPWVNRVSLYGNARSMLRKTPAELAKLKDLGLYRLYMGLESGHDPTLEHIRKGVNSDRMVEAAKRIREAALFLSVTVLLGIAGRSNSAVHARETGRILSGMQPNQIAALTLMPLENTPLFEEMRTGKFKLPDQAGILQELGLLVSAIDVERAQFQANHASNYLPLSGRLPRDKERILQVIGAGLSGRQPLTTESQRAL
ncbi:MAG: radical SAM protein [Deltaproteobacteria bacterium]|nr:radical SAM protein [Deltaproteobacteria bacterium]